MPTKRTKRPLQRHGLTEAVLEAWHVGDKHKLAMALGIGPHQVNPFDALTDRPPADDRSAWAQSWPHAMQLRKQLIEAAGPPGRFNIHGDPLGPRRQRNADKETEDPATAARADTRSA
jgi:hypothetical protein